MKRDEFVIDFPSIVADQIIRETNQGLRLKKILKVPIKSYIQTTEVVLITITETAHGNLTFICPNCNRQNILAKHNVVVAMCKFCPPAESPD